MVGYIFQAALLCGWVALLFFFLFRAMDGDGLLYIAGAVVMTVLTVAVVIGAATQDQAQGPCLKTETSYAYNSVTKTMSPYTHCVDRGEWVKNG